MNLDPLVSVAVVFPEAPHVPILPDAAICLAGLPSEAVAVVAGEGVNCSPVWGLPVRRTERPTQFGPL
jgi:hypothetical protein